MRIKVDGKMWEVYLSDDGTMDTVVQVRPVTGHLVAQEIRFNDTSEYRDENGDFSDESFRELALEAIEGYDFDSAEAEKEEL